MKYLYTTKPDETCHEVEPGIWGRPAHTTEQAKLRKAGWVYNVNDLKESDHDLRKTEEEGREESEEVIAEATDEMAALYEEVIGKKPHHKMKFETMKAKVDEALKDD